MSRGPTGTPNEPPEWLDTTTLPLTVLPAGATLLPIHRTDRAPVFFSPGPNQGPTGRFDSATGRFGVLYMALAFEGAFAETILRNPARRLVAMADIEGRSVAVLGASRPVRLVAMHGAGLQALGLDNAITTGPYALCGTWSDALFAHADQPDGVAYASRHDPEQLCVALFSRPDLEVARAGDSIKLADMRPEVAAVLRRYGKGLDI